MRTACKFVARIVTLKISKWGLNIAVCVSGLKRGFELSAEARPRASPTAAPLETTGIGAEDWGVPFDPVAEDGLCSARGHSAAGTAVGMVHPLCSPSETYERGTHPAAAPVCAARPSVW